MLKRITIKNVALIDELTMDFAAGLNILTGETGAGKSIIIDAIGLVLGQRADRDLIKTGANKASVEAIFHNTQPHVAQKLDELGIELEGEIVLSREVSASGRNVCRINGSLVNNAALQELTSLMIDIHGQHEHQSLFNAAAHINLLDEYAGAKLASAKQAYRKQLAGLHAVQAKLNTLGGDDGSRERRMDVLRFQIDEIGQANVRAGEEQELVQQRDKLANAEQIASALDNAYSALYGAEDGGAMAGLMQASREMKGIAALDEAYAGAAGHIEEIYYSAEAAASEIRDLKALFYFDPDELDRIEERLHQLAFLMKKYGASEQAMLDYLEQAQNELGELQNAEETIERLKAEQTKLADQLYAQCETLSALRQQAARRFAQGVMRELDDLGMQRTQFEIRFAGLPAQQQAMQTPGLFTHNGLDEIEFMLSANPGEPVKPLSRIASGGEASRIMLALKNISAKLDRMECLIFDEIDTGISGRMASVVGQKMIAISRDRQVICITHLAQIACMADRNYLIEKTATEQSTLTQVRILDRQQRVAEVARLLGGEGEAGHGLAHAQELCAQADVFKASIVPR